jgi:hypothetical protein
MRCYYHCTYFLDITMYGVPMKSTLIKTAVAMTLLVGSAAAYAAANGCCGSVECCLKMLACCLG